MQSLATVLIDDEENNRENLRRLVDRWCPSVRIVAEAGDATEGKAAILRHAPDLVFLDIQMPDKNGFELLRELGLYSFEVIFVTAFDQYAIQALRFSAVDYLLKPVNIDELRAAVERAMGRRKERTQNGQLENLLQLMRGQRKEEQRIALPMMKETRYVATQDIVRCESSNNYTQFCLAGGERLIVSRPIYEYEELLADYGFVRCHQSHLVNRKYVRSWVREDGSYLQLENGEQVPVARSKKEVVLRALQ